MEYFLPDIPQRIAILFSATLLDLLAGDPERPWHPVRLIGMAISRMERFLYTGEASAAVVRNRGLILVTVIVTGVMAGTWALIALCRLIHPVISYTTQTILCYFVLSTRSLGDYSGGVVTALRENGLTEARHRLSMLVSRDTSQMDRTAIIRTSIETVSENITDAIIAPLLYITIGGAVCAMGYKAISTLDSMVGYRNDRYRYFGRVAARADDVAAFIPARIAGFFIVPLAALFTGKNAADALRTVIRERFHHESPNSAHGEAAVAGALGISFGGSAMYFGVRHEKPVIGTAFSENEIQEDHFSQARLLMYVSMVCMVVCCSAVLLLYGVL